MFKVTKAISQAAAQTFDYVVVGAGSAGCVLANRLSANPENKVALLEAGGNDNFSHAFAEEKKKEDNQGLAHFQQFCSRSLKTI